MRRWFDKTLVIFFSPPKLLFYELGFFCKPGVFPKFVGSHSSFVCGPSPWI